MSDRHKRYLIVNGGKSTSVRVHALGSGETASEGQIRTAPPGPPEGIALTPVSQSGLSSRGMVRKAFWFYFE